MNLRRTFQVQTRKENISSHIRMTTSFCFKRGIWFLVLVLYLVFWGWNNFQLPYLIKTTTTKTEQKHENSFLLLYFILIYSSIRHFITCKHFDVLCIIDYLEWWLSASCYNLWLWLLGRIMQDDDYHLAILMRLSIWVLTVTSLSVWSISSLHDTKNLSRHTAFHSLVTCIFSDKVIWTLM